MKQTGFYTAAVTLLNELLDGPATQASYVLNPGDKGLLPSLEKLPAEDASRIPASGGASIAAHVDHLRYGLSLMNRWSQGEEPFADADYRASWNRTEVSEAEWAERRTALRDEAYTWREAIASGRQLTETELTGLLASIVHLAYHMGAVRQINRALRGPSAND